MDHIRNFVIIAHIDHGKSTLADRFLEFTGTIDKRRMRAQYLDQLELERERGITIKMAPVKMVYRPSTDNEKLITNDAGLSVMNFELSNSEYVLNLIDTPGHSDFSYEVSRALAAVEGAILLVDATQGIQAQTLANFRVAQAAGLKIIGAVNKIDLFKEKKDSRPESAVAELAELFNHQPSEIFLVSGKTGEGIETLLKAVIEKIPPPKSSISDLNRALIFDSFYNNHKGVIASVRVFDGTIKDGDEINLIAARTKSKIKEIGFFAPELKKMPKLENGQIGYIATGLKDPEQIKIGDTILVSKSKISLANSENFALTGYKEPKPVVFVSFYPEESDEYELLKRALQKLRLNDSALTIEPDQNEVLGRGFKVGFLGRLHFEITEERLRREFNIKTANTFPSVMYKIKIGNDWKTIIKPEELPADFKEIWEPMVNLEVIVPAKYLNNLFPLQNRFRLSDITNETIQDRVKMKASMPLAELISDFDDQLKSVTEGYGSFSYEIADYAKADLVRVEILVAQNSVAGLSRFLPKNTAEGEARHMVERLKEFLPRAQFAQAIQAVVQGRVIAREDIPALRKDVTGYLYGGDRTRKMKLWKKQKAGKKRLKERADVKISPQVFRELLKRQ